MERRREPRIACYQRGMLTLLGEMRRTVACNATELAGRLMRVVLDEAVEVNSPISIETRDWMAFGEVCYSRREYSHYVVGLALDQVVMGLRDIEALRRNRLNERTRAREPEIFSLALHVTKQPLA